MNEAGEDGFGPRRVPIAARVLGGAGLLPVLLAIIVRLSAGASADAELAHFAVIVGFSYVALILSFLGGAWWGLAAARLSVERLGPWLGIAVVPSLVALVLQPLSGWYPGPSAVLLGLAVIATLLVDRRLAANGLAPRWWMRLRVPLSAALGVLTLILAALL